MSLLSVIRPPPSLSTVARPNAASTRPVDYRVVCSRIARNRLSLLEESIDIYIEYIPGRAEGPRKWTSEESVLRALPHAYAGPRVVATSGRSDLSEIGCDLQKLDRQSAIRVEVSVRHDFTTEIY